MLDLITGTLYAIPPSVGGGKPPRRFECFLLIRPQQKKAKPRMRL